MLGSVLKHEGSDSVVIAECERPIVSTSIVNWSCWCKVNINGWLMEPIAGLQRRIFRWNKRIYRKGFDLQDILFSMPPHHILPFCSNTQTLGLLKDNCDLSKKSIHFGFGCVHINPIPGWMDPSKLLMTVAMNATANTGTIWSPTSESSWRPSLKGSRSSVILNEYPSPMKMTRRLHTANTLMVTGQKETEDPGMDTRQGISAPWGPQTWARLESAVWSGWGQGGGRVLF